MGNVPPKKVINADAGDADHVGGNDWDDVVDFLNDQDKTGPVKINTETWFRDGKLKFRDAGNDHLYTHNFANLAANRAINWPLLTADDEPLFKTFAATVTGKTIDIKDNTFASRNYTSILFKVGSTYYAVKYDGTLISSSSTAETVIAAAIALKGVIYFAHNRIDTDTTDWNLSAGFTGFTITDNTYIVCDTNLVRIFVPNGYTGTCFKIGGGSGDPDNNVGMVGLSIQETLPTPQRDWIAIKFEISAGSMIFCSFRDIEIKNALVGIELETTNSRWINSNTFDNISLYSCVTNILFDEQSGNISQNYFRDVNCQTLTGVTTDGFKNISGTNNMFFNCAVWDIDDTGTDANIISSAGGTMIIGGRMSGGGGHFINEGTKTVIIDTGNTINTNVILTPDVAKLGTWNGSIDTAADGLLNGRFSEIAVGTGASSATVDSTGNYRTCDTGATINSISGFRSSTRMLERVTNAYFKTAIYLNSVTNVRIFAGLVASASAPTSSSDPLNALEGVALWLDSAVSANWKRMHNDTSGASAVDDTTITALTSTLYPIEIYAIADNRFRFVLDGTSTDISANIPGSTTNLAYWVYIENTTGASRTMRQYYHIIRNDK